MHFRDFVAGIGDLGDHCNDPTIHGRSGNVEHLCNQGKERLLTDFAHFLLRNAGASIQPRLRHMRVTVWDRQDTGQNNAKRHIAGLAEFANVIILGWLQEQKQRGALEWLHFDRREDFKDLSMRDQLELFRDTAVFIGPGGGGSYLSWIMPRGSSYLHLGTGKDMYLDSHVLSYLPSLHIDYIDIAHGLHDAVLKSRLQSALQDAVLRFASMHDVGLPLPTVVGLMERLQIAKSKVEHRATAKLAAGVAYAKAVGVTVKQALTPSCSNIHTTMDAYAPRAAGETLKDLVPCGDEDDD